MNTGNAAPIYWLLVQLGLKTRHDFAGLAERQHGLTAMQLFTLCLLDSDEPIPMNAISCQLACDASNVTGIVDRLVAQDLIVRRDNTKDRRLKLIAPTPKGVQLRGKILKELRAFTPQGLDQLSKQEQQQLTVLLQKALASPK